MNLFEQLKNQAAATPDATAIVFEEEDLTFAGLLAQVQRVTVRLKQDFGVVIGDRVSWLGLNHPDMLVTLFACARLGAIFSPFNTRLARQEYRYLMDNAQPRLCIFDQNFAGIADRLSEVGNFVSVEEVFADLTIAGQSNRVTPITTGRQPQGNDTLLLVYTSGTTGRPKGVMLSPDAVWANIMNCQTLYRFAPGQNVLITLPLFHVGGLCILLLPALLNGASIHLHARFDPAKTLEHIERQSITTTIFVPAQMAAMMALPAWNTCDLSSLAYLVVGSSLIPLEQIQNWHEKNIPVSQIYGATETGPATIGLEIGDARNKEGSAGTTVSLCEAKIVDPDGHDLSVGERGEIMVRGPNLMNGYWQDQKETDRVLVDGWYATGDVGTKDQDGFYWIVDRLKDVIISGGENIYPAEIEAVSIEHPAIAAISIVGKPVPHWGESPAAVIELQPGASLSAVDYIEFLQDRIARYKQPKSVIFIDTMPRNGMGKIDKSLVRQSLRNQSSTGTG